MCLILFAIEPSADYRLVIAANRDEYYGRPSSQAAFWEDAPHLLGGRDLSAGGTWMGLTTTGRFSAVTNFRETPPHPLPPRSRGDLTTRYLTEPVAADAYLAAVTARGNEYRGFNLLVGSASEGFHYGSNKVAGVRRLQPGYYGLSNQLLNCDWPKVGLGREKLRKSLASNQGADALFDILCDTGDGRAFSNSFIASAEYGTCAQTVILWHRDGQVTFEERSFEAQGRPTGSVRYEVEVAEAPTNA